MQTSRVKKWTSQVQYVRDRKHYPEQYIGSEQARFHRGDQSAGIRTTVEIPDVLEW